MNNMQENRNLPDLGATAKTISGMGEAIVDKVNKGLENVMNNVPTQITTSDLVRISSCYKNWISKLIQSKVTNMRGPFY